MSRIRSAAFAALALALAACGRPPNTSGGAGVDVPPGPVIETIPIVATGGEAYSFAGEELRLGTGRGWETQSAQVQFTRDYAMLHVVLSEADRANWPIYLGGYADHRMLFRVDGFDLMVREPGAKLPAEGLWLIGRTEAALARANALARRLSGFDDEDDAADDAADTD